METCGYWEEAEAAHVQKCTGQAMATEVLFPLNTIQYKSINSIQLNTTD